MAFESVDELTEEEQKLWDSIDTSIPLEEQQDLEETTETNVEPEETKEPEAKEEVTEEPVETTTEPVLEQPKEDSDNKEVSDEIDPQLWDRRFKVKANGKELEFTLKDMVHSLAPKAVDYTQKLQAIAHQRRLISAIEDNGLSQEDIDLFIDMNKGNQEAVTKFLKDKKIDLMNIDVDREINYKAPSYGKSEKELQFRDAVRDVEKSEVIDKLLTVTDRIWDKASLNIMRENPDYIRGLEIDIREGLYDKLQPEATRRKVLDGARKSDLEYYVDAAIEYNNALLRQTPQQPQQQVKPAVQQQPSRGQDEALREARKAAVNTTPKTKVKVGDLLSKEAANDGYPTDEEYWTWANSL